MPQDRHSYFKNYIRYADGFLQSAESTPASRYVSYVTLFSPDLQRGLLTDQVASRLGSNPAESKRLNYYVEAQRNVTGLKHLINLDLKTSLPDDLLALTDKMTMAQSLECRAPFIDHELVEFAASIPDSLKVRGFRLKYLLKKAVKPWLPSEILRRKKRGFGAPMGSWMRKELSPMVGLLLSKDQVKKRGLFNWHFISNMIAQHHSQTHDYTDHLLALVNLELWSRIFLDGKGRPDSVDISSVVSA
jgi:asparagine synthase (glutamine-hydrolysing)